MSNTTNVKTNIATNRSMSNSGLHRSGGLGSPFSRWSLKDMATGDFVKIGNHRGDKDLSIEIDLPEGEYLLATGKGKDRIEQTVTVGESAKKAVADRVALAESHAGVLDNLPELTGSSKQIEWAEQIRKEWLTADKDVMEDDEQVAAVTKLTDASCIIEYRDKYPTDALGHQEWLND